jgi:ribose 1,5-bisphosphokinase PhnN
LLKTSARSPYYFNFHSADLGHSMVIGPSGGGKTVLVNFLMAQLEKFNARYIFIDKDQGAEIFVRASGGTISRCATGTYGLRSAQGARQYGFPSRVPRSLHPPAGEARGRRSRCRNRT